MTMEDKDGALAAPFGSGSSSIRSTTTTTTTTTTAASASASASIPPSGSSGNSSSCSSSSSASSNSNSTPTSQTPPQQQQQQQQQQHQHALFHRIISGSVGSIVTALTVTPLEVVKVRQQASAVTVTITNTAGLGLGLGGPLLLPEGVSPCRKGCGTFVLNNGLMDCVLPRSAVPYLSSGGAPPRTAAAASTSTSTSTAQVLNAPSAVSHHSQQHHRHDGILKTLRRIFHREGLNGIYAGLSPTLVMSVPNTVLYFTAYDEIVGWLRSRGGSREVEEGRRRWQQDHRIERRDGGATGSINSTEELDIISSPLVQPIEPPPSSALYDEMLVPLLGGSTARFLATTVTSPLELVRTRQASAVGMGGSSTAPQLGLVQELRHMVQSEGVASLYRGLAPTLWRDVPFSAVYWMVLERTRKRLAQSGGVGGGRRYVERGEIVPPLVHAGHAFVGGAVAGCVAAGVTAPFDVVKTRRQMVVVRQQVGVGMVGAGTSEAARITTAAAATATAVATGVACDHGGAVAYEHSGSNRSSSIINNRMARSTQGTTTTTTTTTAMPSSTFGYMRRIVHEEGVSALWRGNQTRMVKVAPACAIMISVYELGKRVLGE